MPSCRDCGAQIMWVKTEASGGARQMPIDAVADPDGNVWIDRSSGAPLAVVVTSARKPPAGARRFKAHFATCSGRRS